MNDWFGYKHVNGTIHVKRFFSQQDIDEANESEFVEVVTAVIQAKNRNEAMGKVNKWLNT